MCAFSYAYLRSICAITVRILNSDHLESAHFNGAVLHQLVVVLIYLHNCTDISATNLFENLTAGINEFLTAGSLKDQNGIWV
jgi:hypothetical protein